MLKKAMFGVLLGLTMVPVAAMADTGFAQVHVQVGKSTNTMVLQPGMVAPISMTVHDGRQWNGFRGTVHDLGKAVSYRFQIKDGFAGKAEVVSGLMPLRDGVATIPVRPGTIPAVNG